MATKKRKDRPGPTASERRWVEPVVVFHREFKPNVKLMGESLKTRYSAPSSPQGPFVGNLTFDQFVGGLEKTADELPALLAEWNDIEPELREEYESQLVWLLKAAAKRFRASR